jgi:uncharacterized protein DUF6510
MTDADLRLDGNAAAGLLDEVFGAEITAALGTCATCGATRAIGAVHVYSHAPGTVLRCPECTAMLMCIVRVRERFVVDLRGIGRLELAARA